MFNTPILFLVFNRPGSTKKVFESLRRTKPRKLFIAADGPRPKNNSDVQLCKEVRRIVSEIDWECQISTLFRDTNLGCRAAVSGAITWFFENVEEGIIVEDDCILDDSFFIFSERMLKRYRDVSEVVSIGASNFQNPVIFRRQSYYFSIYNHIWGWATWRRAWEKYDVHMSDWPEFKKKGLLRQYFPGQRYYLFWENYFDKVYAKEIDTWDLQWFFVSLKERGLSIIPAVNLVQNIGFGPEATHTNDANSLFSSMKAGQLNEPYIHPEKIAQDIVADAYTQSHFFTPSLFLRVRRKIKKCLSRIDNWCLRMRGLCS